MKIVVYIQRNNYFVKRWKFELIILFIFRRRQKNRFFLDTNSIENEFVFIEKKKCLFPFSFIGNKELDLISIDPLFLERFAITQSEQSPVNVRLNFRNITSHGLKDIVVYKVMLVLFYIVSISVFDIVRFFGFQWFWTWSEKIEIWSFRPKQTFRIHW